MVGESDSLLMICILNFRHSSAGDELIELTLAGRHEGLFLIHDSPSPRRIVNSCQRDSKGPLSPLLCKS